MELIVDFLGIAVCVFHFITDTCVEDNDKDQSQSPIGKTR